MAGFLLRLGFGYAVAAAVAAMVALAQMPLLFGGQPLGWRDSLSVYAVIAIFAWAGLPFAMWGARRGWTRPLTYAGGGLLAMACGVASMFALSVVRREGLTVSLLEGKALASAVYSAAQLLALGVLPGAMGGWTYWLVAVRKGGLKAQ